MLYLSWIPEDWAATMGEVWMPHKDASCDTVAGTLAWGQGHRGLRARTRRAAQHEVRDSEGWRLVWSIGMQIRAMGPEHTSVGQGWGPRAKFQDSGPVLRGTAKIKEPTSESLRSGQGFNIHEAWMWLQGRMETINIAYKAMDALRC